MTKPVHIEVTDFKVIVRGQLSEFEASAYLQDALALQAKQRAKRRRIKTSEICAAFFVRYQACLIYPMIGALIFGLVLGAGDRQQQQYKENHGPTQIYR